MNSKNTTDTKNLWIQQMETKQDTHILDSAPAARQSNTIDERKKPIRTDTRTHTLRKMVFLSSLILTNFQTTQQEIPKLDGSSENEKKVHEEITKKNVKKTSGYEFYES